jgi:hypothetical protein
MKVGEQFRLASSSSETFRINNEKDLADELDKILANEMMTVQKYDTFISGAF